MGPAAFVLSAGLGTRLAPLTSVLPKPLVPVFHKPLVTFALDSLIAAGAGTLALNTHHLPESFPRVFGDESVYRDHPLRLFHEPLLLDTGGGILNARSALGESTFFLYNGDILADPPLAELLARHTASGALGTLLLRPDSGGGVANVCFDAPSGRVLDLRGALNVKEGELTVYSGIAVFEPEIFDWIPADGPSSIINALLAAMRAGEKIGGMVDHDSLWLDLGTPEAYLEAHCLLAKPSHRPRYLVDPLWPLPVHPQACIESGAILEGMVSVGPGAVIGNGAFLRDSIVWPGAIIEPGSRIEGCIVSGKRAVYGNHFGKPGGTVL